MSFVRLSARAPLRAVYLSLSAFIVMTCANLMTTQEAFAHCYIGARFFPAGLSTDDPCVADELSLPTFSTIRSPGEGGDPEARINSYSFDYAKSITPDFGLEVGRSYLNIKPRGLAAINDWDNLEAGAKLQLFKDPAHEFIFSVGADFDIGGTGARRIAESYSTITPQIYFGKGFGDLPDSMALLKPFAVTGVIGYGLPSRTVSDGELVARTLNTSISLQYSLPYLQANVRDTGFTSVANHLIPMVEFAFETPVNTPTRGQTVGTINPGFIWSEKQYQIGLQAIIPANDRTGNNVGFLAQLHFYLDDIFPNSLGKPLIGAR